jgi:hypothetical protein
LHAEAVELGRRGDDGGNLKKYTGKSRKPKTGQSVVLLIAAKFTMFYAK